MKLFLSATFFLILFNTFSQKAKVENEHLKAHMIKYASEEYLNQGGFYYEVEEKNALQFSKESKDYVFGTVKTPNNLRKDFYRNYMPNVAIPPLTYPFKSKEKLYEEEKGFLEFKFFFGDSYISSKDLNTSQITVNEKKLDQYNYNLDIKLFCNVSVFYTNEKGEQRLLFTKSDYTYSVKKFPATPLSNKGALDLFVSKDESTLSLRDDAIKAYIKEIHGETAKKYCNTLDKDRVLIYTDKNKNGGFDDVVEAAHLFSQAINFIKDQIEQNNYIGLNEVDSVRNRILKANVIWKAHLEEVKFDLNSKDKLITDDFVQSMMQNYIRGLIYTEQWEEARKQLDYVHSQTVKGIGFNAYISHLEKVYEFEKVNFENYKNQI